MSLDSYHVFQKVVEKKSFLRAAEALHLTPSAVSYSISRLEEKLGLTLFFREKNGVRLTREGQEILDHIKVILEDQVRLEQAVHCLKSDESETVRIGAFNSACVAWVPGLIQSFSILYPRVSILVYQGSYRDVLGWLEDGAVHMGFLPSGINGNIENKPLYRDRILCLTPQDFIPKNESDVSIGELKELHIIHLSTSNEMHIDAIIKNNGLTVNTKCWVGDERSLISLVECGFGATLIPELLLESIRHNAVAYPLRPDEYRIIGLAVHKKQRLTAMANQLYHHVLEYFNHMGYYNL